MLPLLGFRPVYEATEYVIVLLPFPALAELIPIQLAEGDAVQTQPAAVVTEKLAPVIPEGE